MAKLEISLLGPFNAKLNGERLTSFVSDKVRALLAYLVVEAQRQHRRSHLAGLFWPDYSERKANQNLRMALSNLRKVLAEKKNPQPYLLVTRDDVQFNQESDYYLDVEQFLKGLDEAFHPQAGGLYPRRFHLYCLQEALNRYQSHFLDQFLLKDCPYFEEWASLRRESLCQRALTALNLLIRYHESRGEYTLACSYSDQLVLFVPWQETAHRSLIRNLAFSGEWTAARRQYQACERILEDELSVSPSPETVSLLAEIQDAERGKNTFSPPDHFSVHDLPPPSPYFVGRERELMELLEILLDPVQTLVTVVGPGGIGKTFLALEAGRALTGMFDHGVYYVPLMSVSNAPDILTALADVLGFSFHGTSDPLRQLIQNIGKKDVLIILDNCEHLLALPDGETVTFHEILQSFMRNAPHVKILATSRERIDLRTERVFDLEGLPYPSGFKRMESGGAAFREDYSAVHLFEKVAGQVATVFELQTSLEPVCRICQLVEGLPLAIELAAASVRTQSVQRIATQIEADIDSMKATARDMPVRHRSLRAVFNHSWSLLTPVEKQILAQLSVFRGGFKQASAWQICQATQEVLSALVDKSLLQLSGIGRYNLHPLVHQFAGENLGRTPLLERTVQEQHAGYFADFVHIHAARLRGPQHLQAIKTLQVEIDNIRSAWWWGVEHCDSGVLARAFPGLQQYYDIRSWYPEGIHLFQAAIGAMSTKEAQDQGCLRDLKAITAQLQMGQGWFSYRLGLEDEAIRLLNGCLEPLRTSQDWESVAAAFLILGHMHANEMSKRKACYQESLELSQAVGNAGRMIEALNALGVVTRLEGDFEGSQKVLTKGLRLCRQHEDRWMESKILNNLGFLARELGHYQEAVGYHRQSIELKNAFSDPFGKAVCLTNLGETALRLGDLEEARRCFQRSYAIYEEFQNITAGNYNLVNLGKVAHAEGDLDEALRCHQEVINISRENNIELVYTRYAFLNLGMVLREMGDFQGAWGAFCQALDLAWNGNYIPQVLEILTHLAGMMAKRKPELAVEMLRLVTTHESTSAQIRQNASQGLKSLDGTGNQDSQVKPLESIVNQARKAGDEIWSQETWSKPT